MNKNTRITVALKLVLKQMVIILKSLPKYNYKIEKSYYCVILESIFTYRNKGYPDHTCRVHTKTNELGLIEILG